MKYISTVLSVIALALIGVLFFLQSHHGEQLKKLTDGEKKTSGNGFKIAYFDMDTLEAHYDYFKDAQAQVKGKENDMNMELSSLDRSNQKKVEAWRQKGNTMTPAESEQAQQEYQAMQQAFQSRKSALEQDLYKKTEDLKTTIRKKIEDFLKDYNKQKSYSFIFAYDPSSFIYYKDTLYNITPDLMDGLNAAYKKKN
ncbi:MAG TPA: OmpH family outer membrane protein [Puia sp.]